MKRRWWAITAGAVIVVCGLLLYYLLGSSIHHRPKPAAQTRNHSSQHKATPPPTTSAILASYTAPATNGLITNEFAHFNHGNGHAVISADWDMTSGSLFAHGNVFWTGNPDTCDGPNALSTNCTDSDVFRLNTVKSFAGNIKVSLSLKQNIDIHNTSCNTDDTCWYGIHAWLRYQNPFNLYYVSLNRADGQVVIKRKVPCGGSDDGTYFVLGSYARHDFTPGVWSKYTITIQTNANQSVTINLYDTAASATQPIASGTDRGGTNPAWSPSCTTPGHYRSASYTPITAAGNVGIRGDYTNFDFTDLQITTLNP